MTIIKFQSFTVLSLHVSQVDHGDQLLSLQSIGGGVSTPLVYLEDALALKRQKMVTQYNMKRS